MTNLEKIEAEERKQQRIIDNNYCCEVCNKRFAASQLQLAHKLSANKPNIKMFTRLIMYHDKMMILTCDKCNSGVMTNRSSNPIEAYELIIDIISHIILNDPVVFDYPNLLHAFDNIDRFFIVNPVSIAQLDILDNFFDHYRKDVINNI